MLALPGGTLPNRKPDRASRSQERLPSQTLEEQEEIQRMDRADRMGDQRTLNRERDRPDRDLTSPTPADGDPQGKNKVCILSVNRDTNIKCSSRLKLLK